LRGDASCPRKFGEIHSRTISANASLLALFPLDHRLVLTVPPKIGKQDCHDLIDRLNVAAAEFDLLAITAFKPLRRRKCFRAGSG
jgi:hypothetical protein